MKRLVFCFDGSWNKIDAPHPTNVLFTAQSVLPIARDGTTQLIYYDEGVGTEKGEKFRGGMFGKGLEKNLNDAYRYLVFNHTPGDEIYIFGFSRGAFTARSFAGLISNCGILGRSKIGLVNDMMRRYRARTDTDTFRLEMMAFRFDNCRDVCVSVDEDEWRANNHKDSYRPGQSPLLSIRYLGVWDTVGALGIPGYVVGASLANRQYQFHDLNLSGFVQSARHAVAIDEHKRDFTPTLWRNLPDLNAAKGARPEAIDAPYQQKWFPGNHGSVGGGGDIRGLADQALDWVWDGAQAAGLRLDIAAGSRIYELRPSDTAPLINSTRKPGLDVIGWAFGRLPTADRSPGPARLHEVSTAARRRWHLDPSQLPEAVPYRPKTLDPVSGALDALDRRSLGIGMSAPREEYVVHEVVPGESLSGIAVHYYQDAEQWTRIYEANRFKIDDPDNIYVGQLLWVPTGKASAEANMAPA